MRIIRIIGVLALPLLFAFIIGGSASAVSASDFQPGRIIDDEVFYNKDALGGVNEIQGFINSHTPSCDTWGTGPSGYGNLTRAQYAQQIMGWSGPPYVCLQNYYENPSTGETSFEKGGGAFTGGISAAQIIYNAAQQYGINPQVLLVTLRKESLNLFSDSWPMKSQYKYAMGYACPDSGPNYSAACVESKSGLYKQVTLAAWQFRYYYDHMGSYNFAPGRWNTIQYSPDPACGTREVYINNYATASLYIYTPYTPNNAALNAYPGTASCGAYGNRNFWFMWQEWFGSPYAGVHITTPLKVTSKYGSSVFSDTPTTISFDMRNDSNAPIDVGGMTVTVRDSRGGNHDFPLRSFVIPARSTVTYTETQILGAEDTYTFGIANYASGVWRNDYPTMVTTTEPRTKTMSLWKAPSLTGGLTLSGGTLQTGKNQTFSYTVRNNSASTQNIGRLGLAVRGPANENLDPSPVASITLAPGQSQTLTFPFKAPYEGRYTAEIVALLNDWTAGYPAPLDSSILTSVSSIAAPRVVLSSALSSSSVDVRVGQNTPLAFSVSNRSDETVDMGKLGISGRDPLGRNVDPGLVSVVLAPNETRVISMTTQPVISGAYQFAILSTRDGTLWSDGPVDPTGALARKFSMTVKDGITITSSLKLTGSNDAYIGQLGLVSLTVKNHGDVAVDLGRYGFWGRDPGGRNVDPGTIPVVLAAREERVVSFPVQFTAEGVYSFGTLQTLDNGRSWREGPSTEPSINKQVSINVTQGAVISEGIKSSVDTQSLHVSEPSTLSFKVKNITSSQIDIGTIGLSGRDSAGRNIDPGVKSIILAPNEERVVSFTIKPSITGVYNYSVISTLDSGRSWGTGPSALSGQSKSLSIAVKPSVTLTTGITVSSTQPTVGQCQNLTFKVKNFDTTASANLGYIGLSGRDSLGRNVDPGTIAVTLSPNEERQVQLVGCYSRIGAYSYAVIQTTDNGRTWTNGPVSENASALRTLIVNAK